MACNSVAVATAKVQLNLTADELEAFFQQLQQTTMKLAIRYISNYSTSIQLAMLVEGDYGYVTIGKDGTLTAAYWSNTWARDAALELVKQQLITIQQMRILAALKRAGITIEAAQQVQGSMFAKVTVR